jgi:hypothetical protein
VFLPARASKNPKRAMSCRFHSMAEPNIFVIPSALFLARGICCLPRKEEASLAVEYTVE